MVYILVYTFSSLYSLFWKTFFIASGIYEKIYLFFLQVHTITGVLLNKSMKLKQYNRLKPAQYFLLY